MNPLFNQPAMFNYTSPQPMAVPQIGTFNDPNLQGANAASFANPQQPPQAAPLSMGVPQAAQPSQFPAAPVAPGGAGQQGEQIMQMLQMLFQLMGTLLSAMMGNQQQQQPVQAFSLSPVLAQFGGMPNIQAIGPMPIQMQNAQAVALNSRANNVERNPIANNALQQSLDRIAQDPEGQALLAEAQRRGVTIEVGDPGNLGAADKASACQCEQHQVAMNRGSVINGVTISRGDQSHIIVRDPNNVETLVHELVHAVSTEDGNSQHEEGIATILGKRVEARLNGTPLEDPNTTYFNKIRLYPELGRANAIEQSLARIGIRV